MFRPASLTTFTVALALSAPVAAQPNPTFKYATDEERAALEKEDQVKWEAAAQAGLILTTGNSRATTFAAGVSTSRKDKRNKLSLDANAAYARASIFVANDADASGALGPSEIERQSSVTTRMWSIKGRYDRFLTDKNALFVAAGMSADRPAGKDLVGNAQLGYSRELYQTGPHTFIGEAGYDFTYEDLVVGSGVAIHSLRGFAGYKGALSEDTALEASTEGLFNLNTVRNATGEFGTFDDTRINSRLALSTKLGERLSFRFSFEAKFDNAPAPRPPLAIPYEMGFVPVAEKLDTKAEATLIVSLL